MSEVWSAGTYERLAARFAPVAEELVGRLAIQPDERVLDLATGTGEVARRIARLGATVAALDIAGPMLEKARASAAEEGLQIAFELGPARRAHEGRPNAIEQLLSAVHAALTLALARGVRRSKASSLMDMAGEID